MKKIIILLTLIFSASLAHAHSFWVNTFESFAHQPAKTHQLGYEKNLSLQR